MNIPALKKAIKDLHGCDSKHLKSESVTEIFEGKTIWEGQVEVFSIEHPQAKECFAWSSSEKNGERYFTVLKIPPIISPGDAVRAAIVSQIKK